MSRVDINIEDGLIPKLNSTVNDNNSIDETDNATNNSTEDENFNNTEDDTNNSTDNDIDDSKIDLDNGDTVAGVIWETLTPRSKGKVEANLKNQILPRGLSQNYVPWLKNSLKGMMFPGFVQIRGRL